MNYENDKPISGNIGTSHLGLKEQKRYMLSELERLKNEWDEQTKIEIPELKTYERREYLDVDRAGVKESVEKNLSGEFSTAVNDAKASSDVKVAQKQDIIDREKVKFDQKEVDLTKALEKDKKKSANDMIKQGISRSSIASGAIEELNQAYDEDIAEARELSETKIKGYELEIALLQKELKNDLEKLKISHANKVQDRIDKILSEIDRENQKIFAYNNEVAQKEQKDAEDRARLQAQVLADKYAQMRNEAKYGYSGEKKENYLQRLKIARDYFDRLSKEQALKELQENEKMYDYLGLYYNRLLSEIMTRR